MDLEALKQAAAALYSAALPYHNFEHALAVAQAARGIADRCHNEGVPVDADVVWLAALFHDAGFHEDHVQLGFPHKEAYSAELARRELSRHGLPAPVVDQVCDAILSTHCDGVCRNNEAKVLRAADLAGLAADYAAFKRNSVRLRDEHELLSHKRVPWAQWRVQSADRVELFLRQDLALTRDYFDPEGRSVFLLRAQENLRRLRADPSDATDQGVEVARL